MSVRVMAAVWEHSKATGTSLLMMLALADFSDDDGSSYPSVATLATKCRMSVRNANHLLASLRDSGELKIRKNEGPKGTNRYRIVLSRPGFDGLKRSSEPNPSRPLTHASAPDARFTPDGAVTLKLIARGGEADSSKPLKPASDEPSLNRQEPSEREAPSRALLRKGKAGEGLTFTAWRDATREKGEKLIPQTDAVFDLAASIGLDPEMVPVQWHHFVATYTEDRPTKTNSDWRACFRSSVRQNWFRLWVIEPAGPVRWTSIGLQAQAAYRASKRAEGAPA